MLENINLFAKLSEKQLQALEKISNTRRYPKGAMLIMEGNDNNQLFIIRSGKVSVFVNDEEGKQANLNYMGAGEYFGELSLLDGKPGSATVATLTECELTTISQNNFRELLITEPEIALGLMAELVARIRTLTDNVKSLALLDVYGRITNALIRLSDDDQRIENPKLTHQDIANMVGSSREMVSRIMKELVVGGYIEQGSNFIQLKKPFPKHW